MSEINDPTEFHLYVREMVCIGPEHTDEEVKEFIRSHCSELKAEHLFDSRTPAALQFLWIIHQGFAKTGRSVSNG